MWIMNLLIAFFRETANETKYELFCDKHTDIDWFDRDIIWKITDKLYDISHNSEKVTLKDFKIKFNEKLENKETLFISIPNNKIKNKELIKDDELTKGGEVPINLYYDEYNDIIFSYNEGKNSTVVSHLRQDTYFINVRENKENGPTYFTLTNIKLDKKNFNKNFKILRETEGPYYKNYILDLLRLRYISKKSI